MRIATRLMVCLSILLLCMALPMQAENKQAREFNRHQLRIGWGDQLFEHMVWHPTAQPINVLPESYRKVYNENMRYTQHVFAEYQYRQNSWFSYGGLIDGSAVLWDEVTRNGLAEEVARSKDHSFYNIVFMPTIYFTYFHHDYVSMYSGLGIGFDINGGTEQNINYKTVVCAPAMNLTLFAVSANYQNWFVSAELGLLAALNSGQEIFLFGSRAMTLSIGRTF